MKVLIEYDDNVSRIQEITYESKYKRINAKGIKDEARYYLISHFGYHAKNYNIIKLFKED